MAEKEKFPVGVRIHSDDLKQVKKGGELKGLDYCYHIESNHHPYFPTKINLLHTGARMKLQVIAWIKKGRIFVDK